MDSSSSNDESCTSDEDSDQDRAYGKYSTSVQSRRRHSHRHSQRSQKLLRQKDIPKSLTFNGWDDDWYPFKKRFRSFAKAQNLTTGDSNNALFWCMEGPAAKFLTNLLRMEPTLDFKEMMDVLSVRFGDGERSLKQERHETIEKWGRRVMTVTERACSDLPRSRVQKLQVEWFCTGCHDKDAGEYVSRKHCATITEALEKYRRFDCRRKGLYREHGRKVRNDLMPRTRSMTYTLCSSTHHHISSHEDEAENHYQASEIWSRPKAESSIGEEDVPNGKSLTMMKAAGRQGKNRLPGTSDELQLLASHSSPTSDMLPVADPCIIMEQLETTRQG
ncbi:uncharacterized protein [Antedon mediterranea]|uniref:uncharacterized protein n=1 Tax=Antedon mediterranea TaxID=105859 RepID=UPI003AF522E5